MQSKKFIVLIIIFLSVYIYMLTWSEEAEQHQYTFDRQSLLIHLGSSYRNAAGCLKEYQNSDIGQSKKITKKNFHDMIDESFSICGVDPPIGVIEVARAGQDMVTRRTSINFLKSLAGIALPEPERKIRCEDVIESFNKMCPTFLSEQPYEVFK